MFLSTLLCTLALAACGGGDADEPGLQAADAGSAGAVSASAGSATSATSVASVASVASASSAAPAPTVKALAASAASQTTLQANLIAGNGLQQRGDATTLNGSLHAAAALVNLSGATPDAAAGTRHIGATASCKNTFRAPASLLRSSPVALPRGSGIFYSATELATWRARIRSGPFITDGDHQPGSPGDWQRILRQAELFRKQGEPLTAAVQRDAGERSRHGNLARDAAFHHLVTGDTASGAAVRSWLLEQVALPANDFSTTLCFQYPDGAVRDGWFAEAPWLARLVSSYDFVRASLSSAERLKIENYLRRNAWFFAAHLDWGLEWIFPRRHQGNYSVRGEDAAVPLAQSGMSRRTDSNGDCRIDEADDPRSFAMHAYVRPDGSLGPRLPLLGQWFNNRKSANALAAGLAGVLLGDAELVLRAKRYTMEWLTYSVFADGAQGEYERNGNYCVPGQGVVYGNLNLQAGLMLARVLARAGDRSLAQFETREGLFGTESAATQGSKSLALVAQTHLQLASGERVWHQHERHLGKQAPREATRLGRMALNINGGPTVDDFHVLSLLSSAAAVPALQVAPLLLREGAYADLPWPGRNGRTVETGLAPWTDAFGVLPAAYLLRP